MIIYEMSILFLKTLNAFSLLRIDESRISKHSGINKAEFVAPSVSMTVIDKAEAANKMPVHFSAIEILFYFFQWDVFGPKSLTLNSDSNTTMRLMCVLP